MPRDQDIHRRVSGRASSQEGEDRPHQVRLPGFVTDKDIGLGDFVKRATSAIGIRPCSGCERRAALLNRWFAFSGR